jgi:hypothetical protein
MVWKTCRCLDEDQPDSHPGPIVAVKGQYMPIKDILLPRLHELCGWRDKNRHGRRPCWVMMSR